jgi:Rps23 Pro-64 3,4-dihydroxylase Tpa1-like proline 4-hydroxylase
VSPSFASDAAAIGARIAARLRGAAPELRSQWRSAAPVRHFVIDDLLPAAEAEEVFRSLPPVSSLMRKKSLRESKWVGVAVDDYRPAVGAHLFAFQDRQVLEAIADITALRSIEADPSLYASGISVMEQGDFLNPHLDNSHDGDQRRYRVLNLLYYVSPGWSLANGGNLELWSADLKTPKVIESRFNRLVVMATDDSSWHSVQRVTAAQLRACLSNYYFSELAPGDHEYRNVTSFRGRPEERWKRWLLRADSAALNLIGRAMPWLVKRNRHRR